jgi:enoyl-CoA hydratase
MTDELIVTTEGGVGRIRLNRPKALHSLTQAMCAGVIEALTGWAKDLAIKAVIIDHAEGRGFCAGGDIRLIAESAKEDGKAARAFFHEEYRMNHLLFTYGKPIVAFQDGVTMGGGVGLSLPCRYRVATERTLYAMPETGIGLFPDVGASWYLSRLPGRVGEFLAGTGARLDGAECRHLGISTHYAQSEKLDAIKAAIITDPGAIGFILDSHEDTPPPARIEGNREKIDRLFASDRLEDIMAALEADGSEWAGKELKALRTKSPQTCKVALRQLVLGKEMTDFAEVMRMEYRLACHIIRRPDFVEGVRAVIVDKDNAPKWDPATPEGVTEELVESLFAPLPPGEEWTPLPDIGASA